MGTEKEAVAGLTWLSHMPHAHVIYVAGNHDWMFDPAAPSSFRTWRLERRRTRDSLIADFPRVTYLQDAETIIDGVKFYGSPWQPYFLGWAFNFPRDAGDEARETWSRIPRDVDVLITHGPPYGVLDGTPDRDEHFGDAELGARIRDLDKLRLHVFGHIHEGSGRLDRDPVTFLNVSICTIKYAPTNRPVVVDFPPAGTAFT